MQDDLIKIVEFIDMSRLVIKRIKMNIVFSFAFNIVGIIFGTLGFLNPVVAIFIFFFFSLICPKVFSKIPDKLFFLITTIISTVKKNCEGLGVSTVFGAD
ncbi:hypothetical protein [Tissierella praeacuta]|uniref:hypothetical protein n=1 Tax=Tissierella praeacuta TaxID=43131 RepID=UPI00104E6FD4|nr:hypothetical protein [Tissierella praeacuta]